MSVMGARDMGDKVFKFSELRPGDVLYYPRNNVSLFVVSVTPVVHDHPYNFAITYMSLFGCAWRGLRAIKYTDDSTVFDHEIWRCA